MAHTVELKMRRLAMIAVTILAIGLLVQAAQEGTPTIVFDTMAKDFGKVTEGEALKHVFTFTNKGTARLDILKVEPS